MQFIADDKFLITQFSISPILFFLDLRNRILTQFDLFMNFSPRVTWKRFDDNYLKDYYNEDENLTPRTL